MLDKSKVLEISRSYGGERYIKSFDGWTHTVVMLYATIMRFDSLSEIAASLQAEARKLCHPGITTMTSRKIIDSTTNTLFSNLLFKGEGRYPKSGKKKGV